ncbi:MAG TPA: leucine-rich repeat protein [Candidatus Caccomorpha excrementavium]|nr:leucine-rich repeat protein [Candidatus Caccomorpha excrementavium]
MSTYCPYCMNPVVPGEPCPSCGRVPSGYRPSSHHFPPGTLLRDRYLVGRALGEGGFGITYLGLDTSLERKVAIKEYFPTSFVKRESSLTLEVTCYTDVGRNYYEKGRDQFLKEARTMARLDKIPGIVRVLDYFPENNTAYIVMEYLEGITLKDLTAREGRIPAGEMLGLLEPVLKAMDAMHRAGVIHRDISPDNLMVLKDGTVTLMDFGCARDLEGGHTMTVTLKHGFAPVEQYTGHGQGPWSDIYALCATVYYCLTGKVPPRALERGDKVSDPIEPPSKLGAELTPEQERALMKGLAVNAEDRWRSAADLYAGLYGKTMEGEPAGKLQESTADEIGKTQAVAAFGKDEGEEEKIGRTEAADTFGQGEEKPAGKPESSGETEYIGRESDPAFRASETVLSDHTADEASGQRQDSPEKKKGAAYLRSLPLAVKAGAGAVVCAAAVLVLAVSLNGRNTEAGPGSVTPGVSQTVPQGTQNDSQDGLQSGAQQENGTGEQNLTPTGGDLSEEEEHSEQTGEEGITESADTGTAVSSSSAGEEEPTEAPETEPSTERITEAATEPSTERRTEATTENRTEAPTEAPTDPEPAGPSGSCGADVRWALEDGTLTISGSGRMSDYEYGEGIPWEEYSDEIERVVIQEGVTQIGSYAFGSDLTGLRSVELPESLRVIGDSAFIYSGIQSITIPSGVTTIENQAFMFTNLTSVRIPASVTSIGTEAFASCYGLREFVVESGNSSYESMDGVLFSKGRERLISYPCGKTDAEYTVPSEVRVIEYDALWAKSNLRRLYIPDTVTELEDYCIGMNYSLTVCGSAGGIAEQYVTAYNEENPGALMFEAIE